ncbi:uncharacterized protein LOC144114819 isoform X1 [Amblyomma americanum]
MPTPTSAGPADGSEDLLVPVAKFTRPEGIVAQVGRESSAISAMDADGAVLEDSVEEHVDGVPQSPAGVSSGPSPSYFQAAHAQAMPSFEIPADKWAWMMRNTSDSKCCLEIASHLRSAEEAATCSLTGQSCSTMVGASSKVPVTPEKVKALTDYFSK